MSTATFDMELQPAAVDNDKLLVELSEIGKELLEWADRMGGWDAKCWEKLRDAIDRSPRYGSDAGAPTKAADDRAIIVDRLAAKADAAGLKPENLDDLIHDLTASVAADINNGGLEDQIACLVEAMGAEHTERELDELIEQHTNRLDKGE